MKNRIRTTCKYIIPLTIIGLFGYHSYSVQSKLNQKEKQTYISLKELSEIAAKIHGVEPPFLDKVMITIVDWFIPIPFINKNESLNCWPNIKMNSHQNQKEFMCQKARWGKLWLQKILISPHLILRNLNRYPWVQFSAHSSWLLFMILIIQINYDLK